MLCICIIMYYETINLLKKKKKKKYSDRGAGNDPNLFFFFFLVGGSLSPPRLNIFTVGNMGVMMCLGQGGLRSLSASSSECITDLQLISWSTMHPNRVDESSRNIMYSTYR